MSLKDVKNWDVQTQLHLPVIVRRLTDHALASVNQRKKKIRQVIASGDRDQLIFCFKQSRELKKLCARCKGFLFCLGERHGKRRDRKLLRQRLSRIVVHSHRVPKVSPSNVYAVAS